MKKIIVGLIFSMVVLTGCKEEGLERTPIREPFVVEYSDNETLHQPVFHLDSVYEGKQIFNIEDCVDYQGELNLKINGKKVTDDVLELDYGEYDLVASFKVKDKESPYAFCRVTITRDIESLKVLLYDEPYGKSEIVYKNQYKTYDVDEIYYYNKEGKLETWYYIENKNIKGYAKDLENINRADRCVFVCDDGQFVLNKMPYQVTVEPNFYLIQESSNSYIVNTRTTEFIEGKNFEYSWDNKFFLPYRDSKTILYRANDTEFEKVSEYDWKDRYVHHIFEEDKLRINLEYGRDDITGVLGSDYQEHYEFDLNTLEMSHVKNKRFEKFKVYEDRRLDSQIIDTRTADSLEGIFPVAFASLGVDGITQWYHLDEGYVAVPFEGHYMYDSTLVDHNGDVMGVGLHVDVHTDIKKGWYLLKGQFNKEYLFNSYKNELIPMAGRVTISPDGSYLIDYNDQASLLSTYEFKNNQYTKLDEVNIHLDGYLSVEWLEDGEFNFHMSYKKTEENPWQYITSRSTIPERFHMKRKGDAFYYDAGLEPEEIILYKEHHTGSEVIGKTSEDQCVFKPLYVFEVIDGDMHIWFEIEDEKGYAHRKLRYFEGQSSPFDTSEYHFVLNDDSIFTYNRASDEEELTIVDEFIGTGYYALRFYDYGYSHKLIHMDTGEVTEIVGHVSVSHDKQYFCNISNYDNSSVIKVFKINEKGVELMTEISQEDTYFYSSVWQDDGSIKISSESYLSYKTKIGYVTLKDDDWLFSWEK